MTITYRFWVQMYTGNGREVWNRLYETKIVQDISQWEIDMDTDEENR